MDTQPIDRLRQLLVIAQAGELGVLGDWLAPRLNDYLENAPHTTLDEALGLVAKRGKAPWYQQESYAQRNAALQSLADKHFGALDLKDQADEILRAVRRYRTGRWQIDKCTEFNPRKYADRQTQLLYEAFSRGHGELPDSRRQFRRILGDTS